MRREVADVVVVGSGAGGAVVAYHAAQAGLNVLIIERGPWIPSSRMSFDELDMISTLYKDGGMQMNATMDMAIMQGECVGGSTAVSNMVMLRPSSAAIDEWMGFGARIDRSELDAKLDEVEHELHVTAAHPENRNPVTSRFVDGARDLGLGPKWMPKATGEGCRGCGYCNHGCVFDTKLSTDRSYVKWAIDAGARVLPETNVEKISYKRGVVDRLRCRTGAFEEPLEVFAKQFVISAGSIGSSALLLKSGIKKNVGTRVSFNAGSMLTAEFDERVEGWDGDQMTSYIEGDGYMIEPTHNPVMSNAVTGPGWFGDHARLMTRGAHVGFVGCLVATEAKGRIVYSRLLGHEETVFRPSSLDMERLHSGMEAVARVFLRVGARRLILPTSELIELESEEQLPLIRQRMAKAGTFTFGSAHPMGGNPISDDPAIGAIDSDFAVHGFDNLFVADASVFPTGCRVNPIQTIMAMSKIAADRVVARA